MDIRHHLLHHWAGILLVSSLVTLAKSNSLWLSAFDGYTFLLVSNLISSFNGAFGTYEPEAVVALIDDDAFEQHYQKRTPFNRCELTKDLLEIYAQKPGIVAIDIDISPVFWLFDADRKAGIDRKFPGRTSIGKIDFPERIDENESICEHQLYELIQSSADRGTYTILLEPHLKKSPQNNETNDSGAPKEKQEPDLHQEMVKQWRQGMSDDPSQHIKLAQSRLHEELGMLLSYKTASNSMPIVVRRQVCELGDTSSKECTCSVFKKDALGTAFIDSSNSRFALRFLFMGKTENGKSFGTLLKEQLDAIRKASRAKGDVGVGVVFVGGAHDDTDLFSSGRGLIYGVEALASIYVSGNIAENHVLDFVSDFCMGILAGLLITRYWRSFFKFRSDENPRNRQRGPTLLLALGLMIFLLAIGMVCFAIYLLSWLGIWLSPIPMLIGALIDLISGPIELTLLKYRKGTAFDNHHHTNLEVFFRPLFLGGIRLFKRDWLSAIIVLSCNVFFVYAVYLALFLHAE